ncbi:MAG: NUDIX hydrolase [Kiritimatiellia bacterium]
MKPEDQNAPEERIIDTRSVYSGRIIRLDVLTVDMGNGATAQREVIRHPGAAAILAELPDGRFVLVEQFRRAVGKRMIEVVAGCLEPGEEPAACARREVEEETGHKVGELIPLGRVFASPGFVCECLHLFYARLDAAAGQQALDEDERVRPLFLKAEQIEARIADGSIEDSKTLSCWLLDRMRRRRCP